MAAIKILPSQVPSMWEAIKFAASRSNRIRKKELPPYLNLLLAALLSGKAQCFVRLSDERELMAIFITRIVKYNVTGENTLAINCLYSFKLTTEEEWNIEQEMLEKFAKANECSRIMGWSINERLRGFMEERGYKEAPPTYIKEI